MTSFKIIVPLFFLNKEVKKSPFLKKNKNKKRNHKKQRKCSFGGINLYVKLVLMTMKIKVLFLEKKPQDLSHFVKKKISNV